MAQALDRNSLWKYSWTLQWDINNWKLAHALDRNSQETFLDITVWYCPMRVRHITDFYDAAGRQ